jgi:sec-independent protein translocase protein TatC
MPLIDHLRELRNRVVKIALAVIAGGIIGYIFFGPIWHFMQEPYCKAVKGGCIANTVGHTLVLTGVLDGFYLRLKIAILAGVIITSPIWLYQLWAFVAPGLYAREKKWTYAFLGTAVPLFGLGVFFAIEVMSNGLRFLMSFAGDQLTMLFTADTYLGFWIAMILGIGLCFEVPLFLVILNFGRVLTHARFKKWRRVIIFLIFVFAGIASPSPDPLTMLMLGGSVLVLVELAEVVMWIHDKRYARSHPEMYANLADNELAPIEDDDTPVS